jgi:riboflavin kinase/FMN adenylyltransferase
MSPEFRVVRRLEDVPGDFGPCALTIGNFDGVHAGHRRILRRVVEMARERGWHAAAMTFHPHPTRVVAPERAPILMSTPGERAEMMRGEGIDEVLILPFDAQVAAWTPEFFVREVLVGTLQARAVLVGKDFRFGHKHAGDTKLLEEMGRELGFVTELIPSVSLRGARVSSSRIRDLVEAGRVSSACRLLTRPFALAGDVVSGHGIGRKQTVPTLNLAPAFEVLPANGVYITRTHDEESDRVWKSVTNVGNRPTFNGDALTIETFLLEPLEQAPGRIRVEFLSRIREERKFDSPEALKTRIFTDVRRAQTYFRRMS